MDGFDLDGIGSADPILVRGSRLPPNEHFRAIRPHLKRVLGTMPWYDKAVVYVMGYDDATDALDGFHDWLVARCGGGRSLSWSALVIFDGLGVIPVHYSSDLPSDFSERRGNEDMSLVGHLFDLLDEFLTNTPTVG